MSEKNLIHHLQALYFQVDRRLLPCCGNLHNAHGIHGCNLIFLFHTLSFDLSFDMYPCEPIWHNVMDLFQNLDQKTSHQEYAHLQEINFLPSLFVPSFAIFEARKDALY